MMSNQNNQFRLAQSVAAAFTVVALMTAALPSAANAQDTEAMAPPVSAASGTFNGEDSDGGSGDVAPSSPAEQDVFQWQDVPQNRQVPITRAVFDRDGYRLSDDAGETIVIPFVNQNLYVLRFGQTSGSMYFVNDGSTPTLYLPSNGYLENASAQETQDAQGARWYPFPQSYDYTSPVFVGPAPSWSDWVDMGWYPDMAYYGGYYGYQPWSFGVAYDAFPGLYFSIGGRPYYGWNAYNTYYRYHATDRVIVRDEPRFGGYSVGRRRSVEFGSRPSHLGERGIGSGVNMGRQSFGGRAVNSFGTSNAPRTFRGGQSGGTIDGGRMSAVGFSRGSVGGFSSGNRSFVGGRGSGFSGGGGGSRTSGGQPGNSGGHR